MPNVGKPSKGCKNCRDRKVKCDQKRPSCSQCLRVNKQCHGYRDPLSMMFKNESEVVARKAKNRYEELSRKSQPSSSRQASETSESDSTSSNSSRSSSDSPPSISSSDDQQVVVHAHSMDPLYWTYTSVPSIEDQGIGFFFSNYVQPQKFVPRGNFDFLSDMLSQPDTGEILQRSVTAAGMASLAVSSKSPQVHRKAREEYVSALSMTNKALQSPETATRTDTLVSVILLGMYENFMYQRSESITAWARHVDGACALLSMRGADQMNDKLGLRIFQQFFGTVMLVALETGRPISDRIMELWEHAVSVSDYSQFGKQWTTMMVRFMQRCINMTQDRSDPVTMVDRATKLDREIDDLRALVPNIWLYETVYLDEPVEYVYGSLYHIYLDPWISQMWNNLRSCRLILHGVIRTFLKEGLKQGHFTKEYVDQQAAASAQVMRATAVGVCASVPQIIGQIPYPELPTRPTDESTSCLEIFDPQDPMFKVRPPGTFSNASRSTGMHNLIWPLYALGGSELCPEELRDWAIKMLYYVALKIGTRQALVLAEELKERQARGFVFESMEEGLPSLPTYHFGSAQL